MPSLLCDRRTFLRRAGLTTAWVAGAAHLVGQDSSSSFIPIPRSSRPVRVTGRVHAGGRGLARVAVTDGATIVQTGPDGAFSIVASSGQPFVYVSVPGHCEIPRGEWGTARFYHPVTTSGRDEMSVEFPLQLRREPAERHAFLALPDPQPHDAEEMGMFHAETVPDVQAWVGSQGGRPSFGVAIGDITFDDFSLYPEYERAVKTMGVPFFQAVGNHDLDHAAPTSRLATSTFMRHFGPTYYSFDVGAVHYVVLHDVFHVPNDYLGYIDDLQLQWLEADLALVEPGRPVVVFLHIPLESRRWTRNGGRGPSSAGSVANREAVYSLLRRFKAHVISGHTHENEHVFEGGIHEHVHGTVCGAWWSGPICGDGTPSGYGIFDVNGESLAWTYKATGKPADYQLRVYAPGSDPTAPDEIVANVWNWDPKWSVEHVVDGVLKGPMGRRTGLDPLAVETMTGPSLPKRNGWAEPSRTSHLFYAPVSSAAREIQVRATDRFGRTFTSEWHRPSA